MAKRSTFTSISKEHGTLHSKGKKHLFVPYGKEAEMAHEVHKTFHSSRSTTKRHGIDPSRRKGGI